MGGATHEIEGLINDFTGADGEGRDWEVKLHYGNTLAAGTFSTYTDGTIWSIGGTTAAKSGGWAGAYRGDLDGRVPEVATGAFYSEHGNTAKMVGAFGANKK